MPRSRPLPVAENGIVRRLPIHGRFERTDDREQPVAVEIAVPREPFVMALDARVHLAQVNPIAARLEKCPQSERRERRLHQRAHVRAQRLPGGPRLHDVGTTLRQELLPENHMTDKAVLFLLREKAAQVPLGEVVFAETGQHHDVKAGVPEPLEWIGVGSRRNVAIALAEQPRIAAPCVTEQQLVNPALELLLDHGTAHYKKIPS